MASAIGAAAAGEAAGQAMKSADDIIAALVQWAKEPVYTKTSTDFKYNKDGSIKTIEKSGLTIPQGLIAIPLILAGAYETVVAASSNLSQLENPTTLAAIFNPALWVLEQEIGGGQSVKLPNGFMPQLSLTLQQLIAPGNTTIDQVIQKLDLSQMLKGGIP